MSDFNLDDALNNLEKAKESPGDGADRVKNTKQGYSSRANYVVGCKDCDWSAERIQARGVVRKVLDGNDDSVYCSSCGSSEIYVNEK